MKKFDKTIVTGALGRAKLTVEKHSPEILLAAGIAGVVTSAVLACKATTKLDAVLENAKFEIDAVHAAKERGEVTITDQETGEVVTEEYTDHDHKRDLAVVYLRAGVEFGKLYGPSILLGATSIACILASNNIIHKRNIALAAAYNVVDTGFKEYRNRVVDRFGEELDRELRYDIKAEQIEETVVNEKGKEKKVKKTVQYIADPNIYSPYARIFNEDCAGWDRDPAYSLTFLKQQENFANDKLRSRGHLFLNEVYDMLGIPRCAIGQEIGWLYDPKDDKLQNFVDFGIFDIYNKAKQDFVNGFEKVIVLDFNVDGPIKNMI